MEVVAARASLLGLPRELRDNIYGYVLDFSSISQPTSTAQIVEYREVEGLYDEAWEEEDETMCGDGEEDHLMAETDDEEHVGDEEEEGEGEDTSLVPAGRDTRVAFWQFEWWSQPILHANRSIRLEVVRTALSRTNLVLESRNWVALLLQPWYGPPSLEKWGEGVTSTFRQVTVLKNWFYHYQILCEISRGEWPDYVGALFRLPLEQIRLSLNTVHNYGPTHRYRHSEGFTLKAWKNCCRARLQSGVLQYTLEALQQCKKVTWDRQIWLDNDESRDPQVNEELKAELDKAGLDMELDPTDQGGYLPTFFRRKSASELGPETVNATDENDAHEGAT